MPIFSAGAERRRTLPCSALCGKYSHMRSHLLASALLCIALLALPGIARAQQQVPCEASASKSAEVRTVISRIDKWQGRCVRLSGILVDGKLYSDRAALAERVRYESGRMVEARPTGAIMLYPDARRPREERPMRVEIVGRIGNCAVVQDLVAAQKPSPDGRRWVLDGLCRVSRALYVRVSIVNVLEASVERLREDEVHADSRLLVDAPPDAPGRDRHLDAARALAAALQRSDETAFRNLKRGISKAVFISPQQSSTEEQALKDEFGALGTATSPLAGLSLATPRMFIDRQKLDLAAAYGDTMPKPDFITCWCRGSDCTGKWPVIARDADNDPARPYICIRSFDERWNGPQPLVKFGALLSRFPLAEPVWPGAAPSRS